MARKSEIPKHLPPDLRKIWAEIRPTLFADCPQTVVEAICGQVKTMRDARQLIEKDGILVMDGRANAVEHPALAIERAAMKQLSDLNRVWAVHEGE